jgi:hypothetical protein
MIRWHLALLCAPLFALPCAAQDVPLPPRPAGAPSSIQSTAQFLQEKLSSIGRVSWTQTTSNTKTGEATGPAPAWEEVSRVTISPGACEMKVAWKSSQGDSGGTYFLEEVDSVAVLTSPEHAGRTNPGVQYAMNPLPYSVVINYNTDFKLRDQQTANQIAGALMQLSQQCRAAPPPSANSGPGLEETLSFIEDKLNGQGAVNWLSTLQDTVAGTSGSPIQMTSRVSNAAGDARACRLAFHFTLTGAGKVTFDGAPWVPLRRVESLSVMSMEDATKSEHARQGHPESIESISPAVYDLFVRDAANRSWDFPFADQDLANRVAKAMLHAVELCGGGKEPF